LANLTPIEKCFEKHTHSASGEGAQIAIAVR